MNTELTPWSPARLPMKCTMNTEPTIEQTDLVTISPEMVDRSAIRCAILRGHDRRNTFDGTKTVAYVMDLGSVTIQSFVRSELDLGCLFRSYRVTDFSMGQEGLRILGRVMMSDGLESTFDVMLKL